MTTENINKIANCANSMASKASLIVKASKMNLTSTQFIVYCKVVKNECVTASQWMTINALKKKGLIADNPNRGNLGNDFYKTIEN